MLKETSVSFRTNNEKIQKLYDAACEKCLGNLCNFAGKTVLVEGGGYNHKIWLETQPMGGEMYAKRNMEAALNNHVYFMEMQRGDGRLPGSIERKGTEVEAQFDKLQGFCFPFSALNMYYWIGEDKEYLKKLEKTLIGYDEYLWKTRDSNGNGCLESFCVFDTGEDKAMRYGDAPNYCRTETPPENSSVVPMESMDIMSFSYAARDTLAQISKILENGREDEWREKAHKVKAALRVHLWNEEKGACYDKDKYGNVIDVLAHNNLRCMYWKSFSEDMAHRFVTEHLLSPEEFWTKAPLPSVAVNDPAFRNAPENNWSGQAEGLTYQRAIHALENYGYETLVTKLGKSLFETVINGGYRFVQQYDPFTGVPSRVSPVTLRPIPPDSAEEVQDGYGPTLLAVLEYMAHIWGVHMELGEIWFSLAGGLAYEYTQVWGETEYKVVSDGTTAKAYVCGKEIFESPCGVRLITDLDGKILRTVRIEEA